MPRLSYATQKAKLDKEISKLQKQSQALQAKRRKPVIASIIKSMYEFDISPDDITAAYGAGKVGRGAKPKRSITTKTVAPKYRHPETGETWSGRGKAPRWISAAEAEGASRESFLIA